MPKVRKAAAPEVERKPKSPVAPPTPKPEDRGARAKDMGTSASVQEKPRQEKPGPDKPGQEKPREEPPPLPIPIATFNF